MTPKFILASNSPRRRELFTMLGMDFQVIVSDCDETLEDGMSPEAAVKELALRKANAAANTVGDPENTFIIAADTVVSDGVRILGKPADKEDAYRTFLSLSNREHSVWTGIAVIGPVTSSEKPERTTAVDAVETKVVFGKISEKEAQFYAETGEPLDKAGSYGIQGLGGLFVTELHGDYYNVVGLPIARLREVLHSNFGLEAYDYINKR